MRLYEINTLFWFKVLQLLKKSAYKNRCYFWAVFPYIWPECEDLLRKSPYSVRIQESKNLKKLRIWPLFTKCMFMQNIIAIFGKYSKSQVKLYGSRAFLKAENSAVENILYLNHYTFPFDSHINPFMPEVHIT